jgi:ABC-type nitrate/sulfonate/bicarbonate transport system substrate-binding protein
MLAWLVLLQTAIGVSVAGPITSAEYLPLRLAQARGDFAREGVAVSLRDVRSASDAAQDLARGRAELAATSLDAALRLGAAGGRPPLLVMGLTAAPPVALLVPAPQRDTVRGPADLAGRTVGIPAPGSPEHAVLLSVLAGADVPAGRVRIESLGERGVAAALAAGTVAAGVIGDPWATRLAESGSAVTLADLRQPGAAQRWLGGPTVHAGIFVGAGTPRGSADVEPFVRALREALRRLAEGDPAEVARGLPADVVGRPEDFAARLAGIRSLYLPDGRVDAARMARSLAGVRERWPIPVTVELPWKPGDLLWRKLK